MSFDITPVIPAGRQLIQGYGDGHFTIAGTRHQGSVIVLPEKTMSWPITNAADVELSELEIIQDSEHGIEILIFGGGPTTPFVHPDLRDELKSMGISIEPMNTGAGCRTFNVLLSEDRRVAAALIAVA